MHEQTIRQFLTDLAARTPTPGGGSTSALAGALGAAAGCMAAAFTNGDKHKAAEPKARELQGRLTALSVCLTDLMDEDVAAYGAYAAARALPKGTPAEKDVRRKALALARQEATVTPERIVATARDGLRLVEDLSAIVNPGLAGDVAVAAYLLEAAARGGAIQVLSNCAADDTDGANARRRAAVTELVEECESARKRIESAVLKMMHL
jgi:formiminotetrahydrofolate cyclodeaminase